MNYLFLGMATVLFIAGCTHGGHPRGSIVTKSGDREAQICIGSNEVKPGDKVDLFDNQCREINHGRGEFSDAHCKKVKIGQGEVVRSLNEHYSVIKVMGGTPLKEGTIVEKQ